MSNSQNQLYPLKGLKFVLPDSDLAAQYCASLLQSLGASTKLKQPLPDSYQATINCAKDWAESGLIPLTGKPDSVPLQGPGCIPSCARGTLDAIRLITAKNILPAVNGATLLSERATALQLNRQGTTSPNGSCHLLETKDGWIAINLAREDDWSLLPALIETDKKPEKLLDLKKLIKQQNSGTLVERGRLMGLPIANTKAEQTTSSWIKQVCASSPVNHESRGEPLVIDLSSLWAGPLCSHLLQTVGAKVIKVESTTRLDGARDGSTEFFNLLNANKSSITLNLNDTSGQQQLQQLISKADIVIEGSRPRALKHMGIDAESIVKNTPGLIWLGITGYGRDEPQANWVAFGDDAAVASGLADATSEPPLFCGDAIGDPLTGLHAAFAALAFWQGGQGGLFDLSLCNTSQHCLKYAEDNIKSRGIVSGDEANWQLEINGQSFPVQSPHTRQATGKAAEPGSNTQAVLQELGIS